MSVPETVWDNIREQLRGKLSNVSMQAWFADCTAVDLTDTAFVLHTPNAFKADIILTTYASTIKELLHELLSDHYDLRVLDDAALQSYIVTKTETDIDEEYTFERFVIGPANNLAYSASKAVADGKKNYNPLFLYGNSGLGKTHLLRAIRHEIKRKHPDYSIVYVRGDDFLNEMVIAIQSDKTNEFRQKYRFADVFLIDDVQFIAGKERTQEEFFHTFNALYEYGRQIVLTSDRPPSELSLLEDRLRTRFESGMMADIHPPDYETRMAIILKKARELGLPLSKEIAAYLSETLTENVRQLEGIVKQIYAYCEINGIDNLTLEDVSRRTRDMIRESAKKLTPDLIISETAAFFDLTAGDLRGPRKTRGTAYPRQIAMFLLRQMLLMSFKDIGDALGGRDHSTVMYGIRNIETESKNNPETSDTIRDITSNVMARAEARG